MPADILSWGSGKKSKGGRGSSPTGRQGLTKEQRFDQAIESLRVLAAKPNAPKADKLRRRLAGLIAGEDRDSLRALAHAAGVKPKRVVAEVRKGLEGSMETSLTGFGDNVTDDIVESVSSIPRGIAGLGDALYQESIFSDSGRKQAAKGYIESNVEGAKALEAGFSGDPSKQQVSAHPLLTQQGASFRNTWNRLSDPAQLVEDYYEHPVQSLVEDAGNVSLVAAPVAAGLKAGGAVGAGTKAASIARAADTVAQGPFLGVSATARVANRGLRALGEAAERSEPLHALLSKVGQDAGTRSVRRVLRDAAEDVGQHTNRQATLGKRLARLLPDDAEAQAMYVVGEGQAPALAALRRHAPEQFDGFVSTQFGDTLSPEGAHIAADYADGIGDARARIDEALRVGHEAPGGRAERTATYADRPERREQLGYEPLSRSVAKATKKSIREADRARALADRLRLKAVRGVEALAPRQEALEFVDVPAVARKSATGKPDQFLREDVQAVRAHERAAERTRQLDRAATRAEARAARLDAKAAHVEANARYAVENAPARLRPALSINREVQSVLTKHENALRSAGLADQAAMVGRAIDEIPTTLEQMKAEGLDFDQFIHVRVTDRPMPGSGPGGRLSLPKVKKPRSARYRGTANDYERSIPAQARGELDELKAQVARQTAEKIGDLPLATRLNEGPLAGAVTKEQAYDLGYVAWDPRTPFETPSIVSPDTVFLPAQVKKTFRSYFEDPLWDRAAQIFYDPITKAFKVMVLPLSPSWQLGNMFGNAFLATIGAGVDPVTLVANITKAIKEYRKSGPRGQREWGAVGPERLYASGATHEALDFLSPAAGSKSKIGKALGYVPRKGYALNEFIDNVGRSAVYLAKKNSGRTSEQAISEALRAMGDFTKMSMVEKRVVRRVIPFYAWQRHITKLAFTLPVEHPIRTAWTLSLADQYGHPDEWVGALPPWMQSIVSLGGGSVLNPTNLFPFPTEPWALLTPEGLARSAAPQLKFVAANASGINPNTMRPYSRPPGTGKLDDYGNEVPTAPSIFEQLRALSPQARLADTLSGREDIARYDTGDPVKFRDDDGNLATIPTPRSDLATLARWLGVSIDEEKRLVDLALTALSKKAAAKRTREPDWSPRGGTGTPSKPTIPDWKALTK